MQQTPGNKPCPTPGKLMMTAGAVLLLCAALLLGYNQWDDYRAGRESQTVAAALIDEMGSRQASVTQMEVQSDEEAQARQLSVLELDGAYYVGLLTIPTLDRTLPVQSDWSEEKLKHSPCRYSGSLEEGELVVAAHNYKNHFGGINRLSVGDSVIFTDLDEKQYFYEVQEISTVDAADIEGMTQSGYDLSLFTCNYDRSLRITVRCMRVYGGVGATQ